MSTVLSLQLFDINPRFEPLGQGVPMLLLPLQQRGDPVTKSLPIVSGIGQGFDHGTRSEQIFIKSFNWVLDKGRSSSLSNTHLSVQRLSVIFQQGIEALHFLRFGGKVVQYFEGKFHLFVHVAPDTDHVVLVRAQSNGDPNRQSLVAAQGVDKSLPDAPVRVTPRIDEQPVNGQDNGYLDTGSIRDAL
jgi:hypothetical protein